MTNIIHNKDKRLDQALTIREEALRFLTGPEMAEAVDALRRGKCSHTILTSLLSSSLNAVHKDMQADPGWNREYWILDDCDQPHLVEQKAYETTRPDRRFSNNECLRQPVPEALALRAVLSALVSSEVQKALSKAIGEPVRFRSADMARYDDGTFLRRHTDMFEDRIFGFVWFISDGWIQGNGGELFIEADGQDCVRVAPRQGTVALFQFRHDCFHGVAPITTAQWQRYSIATHLQRVAG